MTGFTYGKKTLEFGPITGVVLDSEKISQTKISAGSGGGHVHPIDIKSTSTINHQFWIRDDSGVEKDIQLVGYDIPLRVGQRISLSVVGNLEANSGMYSALINHNADKVWILKGGQAMDEFFGLATFHWFKALLIALAVWIVVGLVSLGVLGFFAACGAYGYQFWRWRKQRALMWVELDAYHLEMINAMRWDGDDEEPEAV